MKMTEIIVRFWGRDVVKLELCREAGNGASIAATFDLIFSISSNQKSLRKEARFRHCPTQATSTGGLARAFSF
jgi:hypothetical protein